MNKKLEKGLDFFMDVGLVSWVCFLFGAMVFIVGGWEEHKLNLIFGLIALVYGLGRIHQVLDKQEIIKEIKKIKDEQ